MNVGYYVDDISLKDRYVVFKRTSDVVAGKTENTVPVGTKKIEEQVRHIPAATGTNLTGKNMKVCGYTFRFLQEIIPECDENGKLIDYSPQDDYYGKNKKSLNKNGAGYSVISPSMQMMLQVYISGLLTERLYTSAKP